MRARRHQLHVLSRSIFGAPVDLRFNTDVTHVETWISFIKFEQLFDSQINTSSSLWWVPLIGPLFASCIYFACMNLFAIKMILLRLKVNHQTTMMMNPSGKV